LPDFQSELAGVRARQVVQDDEWKTKYFPSSVSDGEDDNDDEEGEHGEEESDDDAILEDEDIDEEDEADGDDNML
jgi:hypothetical protein